jgi:hypothetical protein
MKNKETKTKHYDHGSIKIRNLNYQIQILKSNTTTRFVTVKLPENMKSGDETDEAETHN